MTLDVIRKSIINDSANSSFTKKGWVPVYTANEDARILIIGQAPGHIAQESTVPWNDKSGDNLRTWMNINRDTFYDKAKIALVPMDFYFPGSKEHGDMPPRKDFAAKWHPKILACMTHIKLTILIGQYAQTHYLEENRKETLTKTVRAYKDYLPEYFPLVHPSPRNNIWQKKNPWFKEDVLPNLQKVVIKALW
ncbi:uracil-DNA glycosylase family protein [Candidatus Kaiserbacteria bacterium]|nr:MAG: uracil-DNA glycosylase family protein [Candidatus Kaiserbacteria bacterium]